MIPHLLRCQGLAVKNLRLRPWTPWIWGILGFCNNRVNLEHIIVEIINIICKIAQLV